MHTYEVRVCYPWGAPGWALVCAALGVGSSLWAVVWWYAYRMGDVYFLVMAASSVLSLVLQYAAAAFLFDQPVRDALTACNNNVRAAPDLAVWLLFQYLALVEVHDRWAGTTWSWWAEARRVALGVGVTVVLVTTRNTTWAWAAEGAAFGVATALITAAVLLVALEPRATAAAPYLSWLGVGRPRTWPLTIDAALSVVAS